MECQNPGAANVALEVLEIVEKKNVKELSGMPAKTWTWPAEQCHSRYWYPKNRRSSIVTSIAA